MTPRRHLTPRRTSALGIALLLVVGACATSGPGSGSLRDSMQSHFRQVAAIQTAVIAGDLDGVREPAERLALSIDHPDLPRGPMSPADELRQLARQAAQATSLREAADLTGRMGAACARCHTATGGGPRLDVQSMPTSGAALQEHMARHQWGADRMWEGLIAPSDRLWRAGATALAEEPLFAEAGEAGGPGAGLARSVHELGSEALRTRDAGRRAGLYGRLLATCAGCHESQRTAPLR